MDIFEYGIENPFVGFFRYGHVPAPGAGLKALCFPSPFSTALGGFLRFFLHRSWSFLFAYTMEQNRESCLFFQALIAASAGTVTRPTK
jgi:hypothetical protein